MSERIHVLAQQLLGRASVADCNLQEIRALVQRYPYFAPAQFLLLQKLREEGDDEAAAQMQKAILYYHNPLSFHYFIDSNGFYIDADLQADERKDAEGEAAPESHAGFRAGAGAPVSTIATDEHIPVPAIEETILPAAPGNPEVAEESPSLPPPPPVVEPATEPPLAFEPYHTVDYFASQGIRLSAESMPTDKFGKQLKSFTEWLKTMKRITPEQMATRADNGSENAVQHLAEDSIHNADVWTEAMAEVWLKQGNKWKAAEVYNKLSLLNPSKKAYFAAKLENLKLS